MKTVKKLTLGSVALGVSLLANALTAEPSQAIFLFQATETGGNVVLTGSGSINTTGLTFAGSSTGGGNSGASGGYIQVGPGSFESLDQYEGTYTPFGSFGSGGNVTPSSTSGDNVLFNSLGIFVPDGYNSGDPLSGTSTFTGASFASLGWTPGTYTSSWGSGINVDSATLQIGPATPIPLETDALPIVGSLAFMGAGIWVKKRRKANVLNLDNNN